VQVNLALLLTVSAGQVSDQSFGIHVAGQGGGLAHPDQHLTLRVTLLNIVELPTPSTAEPAG
jgi:hypothetical protein